MSTLRASGDGARGLTVPSWVLALMAVQEGDSGAEVTAEVACACVQRRRTVTCVRYMDERGV